MHEFQDCKWITCRVIHIISYMLIVKLLKRWLLGVLGDLGNSIGNIYTSPSLLPETRDCLFCAVIQIIKLIWSIQTIYVVDKFSIVDRVKKFGVDFDAIFVR